MAIANPYVQSLPTAIVTDAAQVAPVIAAPAPYPTYTQPTSGAILLEPAEAPTSPDAALGAGGTPFGVSAGTVKVPAYVAPIPPAGKVQCPPDWSCGPGGCVGPVGQTADCSPYAPPPVDTYAPNAPAPGDPSTLPVQAGARSILPVPLGKVPSRLAVAAPTGSVPPPASAPKSAYTFLAGIPWWVYVGALGAYLVYAKGHGGYSVVAS